MLQVQFLPQRAVVAPGASLAEQLAYGCSSHASSSEMHDVLRRVGLQQLLLRVDGDLHHAADWRGDETCAACREKV